MAKIISVINYKGGVGKTTMTLQLGVGLATLYNKKVLMVDLDPQCSLSLSTMDEHYWADWLERKGSVASVVHRFYESGEETAIDPEWIIENALDRAWDTLPGNTPGLDLLPSHLDLPDFEMRLMSKKPRSIASMEEFYLVREKGGRASAKFLGIVRNRVRTAGAHLVNEHEEQSKKLRLNYEDRLLDTMIIDRIGVAESLGLRQNIYNSKSEKFAEIRKDFTAMVKEVMGRLS